MDEILTKAYKTIFGYDPDLGMADWQVAETILDKFDVPKLGEHLAKACIYRIVNHLIYPDQLVTTRIVQRAENLAGELWDDLSDEPHMTELEWLEYKEYYE